MVEALSKLSYYPSFFDGSMVKQGAYSLAKRVSKPSLSLLFTISIIGLVVYHIFSRITRYPRLLEEAVREGNEGHVTYYLGCNTRFRRELIFEAKNPQVIRLLLLCGADKKTRHEGKSFPEHLFDYLRENDLYKEGMVKQKAREWVHLMKELFEPSDLESAIAEGKWDYAAFLMQLDPKREDPRPVLFRAEQPEMVSALLRSGADRKAQHESSSFLLYLFEKGWERLAEEAWDDIYLKDEFYPDFKELRADCNARRVKLGDLPKFKYRKFLERKRRENPLQTHFANHGLKLTKEVFHLYLGNGMESFATYMDRARLTETSKKETWHFLVRHYLLFKLKSGEFGDDFDREMIKFARKGVDFKKVEEEFKPMLAEIFGDQYPPSLFLGLFCLKKQALLQQLIELGHITTLDCVPEEVRRFFPSRVAVQEVTSLILEAMLTSRVETSREPLEFCMARVVSDLTNSGHSFYLQEGVIRRDYVSRIQSYLPVMHLEQYRIFIESMGFRLPIDPEFIAAEAAQSASRGADGLLRGRVPLAPEERSSTR